MKSAVVVSMEPNLIQNAKGLLRYELWLEEEIFRFQREAYPERPAALVGPRWRWMFLASAARLGVEPMVWLYRGKNGVAAHQGAIPVRLKLGTVEHTTGWFVETMALESVRGRAIGPMLVKKALEDLPLNLSLGQTQQMRELQFALGWKQVVPLRSYMLVLNPRRVLAEKTGSRLLRSAAAGFLTLHGRLKRFGCRARLSWTPRTLLVERFDQRHDRLWQEVAGDYPCAVVRDASFLNWKFVEQPGQEFVRLEIRRNGQVAALAVLVIREPDSAYRYRRAMLLDLVVSASDRQAVWAALDAVRRAAQERGADAVVFDLTHKKLEKLVASYGFLSRKPTRVLLLATGGLSHQQQQLIGQPESWLLTRADSDIDRPS